MPVRVSESFFAQRAFRRHHGSRIRTPNQTQLTPEFNRLWDWTILIIKAKSCRPSFPVPFLRTAADMLFFDDIICARDVSNS